jgi:hypothetical protein
MHFKLVNEGVKGSKFAYCGKSNITKEYTIICQTFTNVKNIIANPPR